MDQNAASDPVSAARLPWPASHVEGEAFFNLTPALSLFCEPAPGGRLGPQQSLTAVPFWLCLQRQVLITLQHLTPDCWLLIYPSALVFGI